MTNLSEKKTVKKNKFSELLELNLFFNDSRIQFHHMDKTNKQNR